MKKFSLLLLAMVLATSCSEKKKETPENVYKETIQKLENSKTLQYDLIAVTPPQSVLQEKYTIQKMNYEPYLHYFFKKEIKGLAKIYYNLDNFTIVQDSLKKVTHFDLGNDPYIHNYLTEYNQNEDNLVSLTDTLKVYTKDYKYLGEEKLDSISTYKFQVGNDIIWEDVNKKLPVKLVINPKMDKDGKIAYFARSFKYTNIVLDKEILAETFVAKAHPNYESSIFKPKVKPLINKQAKSWTLSNLDGKKVSLSDFKGQNVFLEGWNSNCSHCIATIPVIKEIQEKYGNKLKVITVGLNPNIDELKQAVKDHDIHYPVLLKDTSFSSNYDITQYPAYYLIDKTGKIIYYDKGTIEGSKKKQLFQVLDTLK